MPKTTARRKTHARSSSSRSSARTTVARGPDALSLLREDHTKVQRLFKEFEKSDNFSKKQHLAKTICEELTVHTTLEEEIFYPAVREALDEQDLIDEADVEHASARDLIAQIEEGNPNEDHWEAKVTVLGEYINHHVKEEQEEIFPKVRKAGLDLKAIGQELKSRKSELTAKSPPKMAGYSPARSAELQ